MRDKIFRAVAALLFAAMIWTAYQLLLGGYEIWPGGDEFIALVGLLLLAPTFAAYALLGEDAAYNVLLPGMALVRLPEIVFEKLLRRFVTMPDEADEPESDGDGPER